MSGRRTEVDLQLNRLESAGLIQQVQIDPALEFVFRHALIQDAAYASLLKQDRRRLHLVVGEVLEQVFADRLDEYSAMLGQHFAEGGDLQRGVKYLTLAGNQSMRRYAIPEAIAQYNRAIALAEPAADQSFLCGLLGLRGAAYETQGNFDAALADYEVNLQVARQLQDRQQEWQSLLNLGMLWAGRDYSRTGPYYERAYDPALTMGDRSQVAHTLNRLANWHTNTDDAPRAIELHRQAQAIFASLGDDRGLSETLDYLGMATALGGDLAQSISYYRQALELLEQFDERERIIYALAIPATYRVSYQSSTLAPLTENGKYLSVSQYIPIAEKALRIARASGLRPAEAFCLAIMTEFYGSIGDYARALACGQSSLALAQEIGHRQWMVFARCVLGWVYFDIWALDRARTHLEDALELSLGVNSWHWIRVSSGMLAAVCLAQQDLPRAREIIGNALSPGTPARSLGQRLSWCARADLALAEHDPELVLHIADQLIDASPQSDRGMPIVRMCELRGRALALLGRINEAEVEFTAARDVAEARGVRPMLWRELAYLGKLHYAQGDTSRATQAFEAARQIAVALAASISDADLRQGMLDHISAWLAPDLC
jgi:tetratricopeptide (TPR) repeat protein